MRDINFEEQNENTGNQIWGDSEMKANERTDYSDVEKTNEGGIEKFEDVGETTDMDELNKAESEDSDVEETEDDEDSSIDDSEDEDNQQ